MAGVREIWSLTKESASAWIEDYASSMGAALSYYSLFSMAPLFVLAISIAGLFFGEEAARGEILEQMRGLVGEEGAAALQGLLKSASKPANTVLGIATGIVVLIIGATTVFGELQTALDRIWDVPRAKRPSGIWGMIRSRLLSLGLVAAIGFLIIVSLVASAVLAVLGRWWGGRFGEWQIALQIVNQLVNFAVFTGLFALIYKLLPSVKIAWRDVWIGAAATSLLFAIGKFLIGYYLAASPRASALRHRSCCCSCGCITRRRSSCSAPNSPGCMRTATARAGKALLLPRVLRRAPSRATRASRSPASSCRSPERPPTASRMPVAGG